MSPCFGIRKPMLKKLSPDLNIYTGNQGAKIVAVSGHLEFKKCTELFALPAGGESARSPFPKTPPHLSPSGLCSPVVLPWKKSCGRPWNDSTTTYLSHCRRCPMKKLVRLYKGQLQRSKPIAGRSTTRSRGLTNDEINDDDAIMMKNDE